jgi:hypothetical protein
VHSRREPSVFSVSQLSVSNAARANVDSFSAKCFGGVRVD